MDIEEIAKIDLFLKQSNGLDSLINVENLIITSGTHNSINKLKEGAHNLNGLCNIENPKFSKELKETWQNLFSQQVKFSVNRVKTIGK